MQDILVGTHSTGLRATGHCFLWAGGVGLEAGALQLEAPHHSTVLSYPDIIALSGLWQFEVSATAHFLQGGMGFILSVECLTELQNSGSVLSQPDTDPSHPSFS